MPAQERIWGDDRGDLAQPPTAQPVRPHGKPTPLVIGQLQASAPQLPAQDTVLFNEIAEYVSVLAVQPPGEDGEQQLERRDVDHGGNLYHGPISCHLSPVDPPRDTTGLTSLPNVQPVRAPMATTKPHLQPPRPAGCGPPPWSLTRVIY